MSSVTYLGDNTHWSTDSMITRLLSTKMPKKARKTLVTIRRSEIPLYLHSSELYLSFGHDDDDDDEISIPSKCMKMTTTVKCRSDLDEMLSTIRFWILSTFPSELVEYVAETHNPGVKDLVNEYKLAFPTLHNLVTDLLRYPSKHSCMIAAKHGCLDFLKYFAAQKKPLTEQTLKLAADEGHLHCMSYCYAFLIESGVSIDLNNFNWSTVIQLGRADCLCFLLAHGLQASQIWCYTAANEGQLLCLQHLMSVSADRTQILTIAAARGNQLACLQYLIELGCEVTDHTWEASMTHSHTTLDTSVANTSNNITTDAYPDNLSCLQYLLDTLPPPEGAFTLVQMACRNDNVFALRYLHQRGYACSPELIKLSTKAGSFSCLQFLNDELYFACYVPSTMAAAAGAGQLELVKQLHEQGCVWDESAPTAALQSDQDDCLRYLFEQRGIPTSATFSAIHPGIKCRWVVDHFRFLRRLNKKCIYYFKNDKTTIIPDDEVTVCRCYMCKK